MVFSLCIKLIRHPANLTSILLVCFFLVSDQLVNIEGSICLYGNIWWAAKWEQAKLFILSLLKLQGPRYDLRYSRNTEAGRGEERARFKRWGASLCPEWRALARRCWEQANCWSRAWCLIGEGAYLALSGRSYIRSRNRNGVCHLFINSWSWGADCYRRC